MRLRQRERLRATANYAAFTLPDETALKPVKAALQKARASLQNLPDLIASEARLLSELLEPAEGAIQSYTVRCLHVFDQVPTHTEQIRQQIHRPSPMPRLADNFCRRP